MLRLPVSIFLLVLTHIYAGIKRRLHIHNNKFIPCHYRQTINFVWVLILLRLVFVIKKKKKRSK